MGKITLFDEFEGELQLNDYIKVDSSLLVFLKLMESHNLTWEDVYAKLLGVLEE